MSRISTLWIAATILSAAASVSPGRIACQATVITPLEPATLGEFFRVDQTTGAPTPLEHVKIKTLVGPVQGGGFLKPVTQTAEYYIEGVTSPVTFKAGEPQEFVIRLMGPGDSWGKYLSPAELRMHIGLGPLLVQDGENQRGKSVAGRFITKTAIPFDIEPFGQPTLGLDPKNPVRAAQSLLLTPRVPLPPGKYQIGIVGVHNFELVHNALVGREYWAFDIVSR
jgi:hypothetical protein